MIKSGSALGEQRLTQVYTSDILSCESTGDKVVSNHIHVTHARTVGSNGTHNLQ